MPAEFNNNDADSSRLSLMRLNTLSDCFFALALILLIIFIEKPPADMKPSEEAIRNYLTGQFEVVAAYLVTFISIACYWFFTHNQGKYLRRSDNIHVWLTLIVLLFVGFLPFSNALNVAFPGSLTVHLFYSTIVFLVGLLLCIDWLYATRKDRLVDRKINPEKVNELIVESLVQPIAALISIGGAFVSTVLWQLPFMLIPVAIFIINSLWKRQKNHINIE